MATEMTMEQFIAVVGITLLIFAYLMDGVEE